MNENKKKRKSLLFVAQFIDEKYEYQFGQLFTKISKLKYYCRINYLKKTPLVRPLEMYFSAVKYVVSKIWL